jgi:hypothetical protein
MPEVLGSRRMVAGGAPPGLLVASCGPLTADGFDEMQAFVEERHRATHAPSAAAVSDPGVG